VTLRNWSKNITYSTDMLRRPTSVDELQKLVADADRIHALGTGHTFNAISDTDGVLVSVAGLAPRIDVDPSAQTATASAGLSFGELSAVLHETGWALHNLGSLPHISLAGACATGTHGGGDTNRCLAATVVSAELVAADGSLVRVDADDPTFGGSVLALGALGIVTSLTMTVEPTYEIRQDIWLDAPFATVTEHFDEIMAVGCSVSLLTAFGRPQVLDKIWIKTRTDQPVADGAAWGARAATTPVHPTIGQDPSATTEQLGVPGPWHERLPHFRPDFTPSSGAEQQSEYLLPREHYPRLIDFHALVDRYDPDRKFGNDFLRRFVY
jgi:alditol oxidase